MGASSQAGDMLRLTEPRSGPPLGNTCPEPRCCQSFLVMRAGPKCPSRRIFFISYTGADKKWAEWIVWILEEAGYKIVIQSWDFNAAFNFVVKMQSGAMDATRTIAVITPDYFQSAFTKPEWAVAFADDPASESGKLVPIRVGDFNPPGSFQNDQLHQPCWLGC